ILRGPLPHGFGGHGLRPAVPAGGVPVAVAVLAVGTGGGAGSPRPGGGRPCYGMRPGWGGGGPFFGVPAPGFAPLELSELRATVRAGGLAGSPVLPGLPLSVGPDRHEPRGSRPAAARGRRAGLGAIHHHILALIRAAGGFGRRVVDRTRLGDRG